MSRETPYRRVVVKELKKNGQDPVPVENGDTSPGTPDVECLSGWIELKAVRDWPKRADTPLRIDHFTPQQRNFLRRRWNRGGGAWLLIEIGSHREIENLLFNGPDAADFVHYLCREKLYELAVMHTFGKIKGRDLVAAMRKSRADD